MTTAPAASPQPAPLRSPRLDPWLLEPCRRPGCGAERPGGGNLPHGWVRVAVGGSAVPPRIFCCGICASRGLALAELRIIPKEGAR